jgi:hypothetical protein
LDKIFELANKLALLAEVLPKMDIKVIELQGKQYVAILIEKPQTNPEKNVCVRV